jgi:hypothetical protein
MNAHLPATRRKWPGRLVNLAVVVVVLALAGATFVLSYTGVHAIVVQAGVSARLSRLYPGLFDAVFVIACVAAVMLRDARWWTRAYAWLVIIVMVAVVGTADAVHAMNVALPHRKTEGVVAAVPWILVLLGFSLMLTMLRHSRAQHAEVADADQALPTAEMSDQAAPAEPPTVVDQITAVTEAPPAREAAPLPEPAPTREEPVVYEPTPTQPMAAETAGTQEDPSLPDSDPDGAGTDQREEPGTPGEEPAAALEEATPAAQDPATDFPERAMVPEIDQDAPPFATAPFATVPRLNRVRSTPIPPEDDED